MKKQFIIITSVLFLGISVIAQNSNSKIWSNSVDQAEIPISIIDREVNVKAKINGVEGIFYWDTGAPTLILNTEAETNKKADKTSSNTKAYGATGKINSITQQNVESFELYDLKTTNTSVLGMPLSHIDDQLLGLIGTKFMEGYLTEFDFKSQKIIMNKLDASGEPADPSLIGGYTQLDVSWYSHIPIVEVTINGHKLNMLLDSGCSEMMINPEHKEKLTGAYSFVNEDTLRGAGKKEKLVEINSFNNVEIAGHSFNNVIGMFETGVQSGHGSIKIDGIIGWDIFWACKLAYNIDKKVVYIKAN